MPEKEAFFLPRKLTESQIAIFDSFNFDWQEDIVFIEGHGGYAYVYLTKQQATQLIPNGIYCYMDDVCPFWNKLDQLPSQSNGHCHFLRTGDVDQVSAFSLLWDQCKECGENEEEAHEIS